MDLNLTFVALYEWSLIFTASLLGLMSKNLSHGHPRLFAGSSEVTELPSMPLSRPSP